MKKQTLILIIGMLLITLVVAGEVTISIWNTEKTLDIDVKNLLLTKTNELNYSIDLKCLEYKCYYSVKGNLVNIDDVMDRQEEYCVKEFVTKDWSACEKFGTRILTEEEVYDKVSKLVVDRLTNYANTELNKVEYNITSKGVLTLR